MGIHRDDTFKRYMIWRDLDRILKDTADHIRESPFEKNVLLKCSNRFLFNKNGIYER